MHTTSEDPDFERGYSKGGVYAGILFILLSFIWFFLIDDDPVKQKYYILMTVCPGILLMVRSFILPFSLGRALLLLLFAGPATGQLVFHLIISMSVGFETAKPEIISSAVVAIIFLYLGFDKPNDKKITKK